MPEIFTDPFSTYRELSFDISAGSVGRESILIPLLQNNNFGAPQSDSHQKYISNFVPIAGYDLDYMFNCTLDIKFYWIQILLQSSHVYQMKALDV